MMSDEVSWESAAQTAIEMHDDPGQGVLAALPMLVMHQNRWDVGARLLPAAISAREACGLSTFECSMVLAICRFRIGESDYVQAFDVALDAAATDLERAMVLANYARVLRFDGRLAESLQTASEAEKLYRLLGNLQGIAQIGSDVAGVLAVLGDEDGAVERYGAAISELLSIGLRSIALSVQAEAFRSGLGEHPLANEFLVRPLGESSQPSPSAGELGAAYELETQSLEPSPSEAFEVNARVEVLLRTDSNTDPHALFEAWARSNWLAELEHMSGELRDELGSLLDDLLPLALTRSDSAWIFRVSAALLRRRPPQRLPELKLAISHAKKVCHLTRAAPATERAAAWLALSNLYHDATGHNFGYLQLALGAMRRATRLVPDDAPRVRAHVNIQHSNLLILRGDEASFVRASQLLNSAIRYGFRVMDADLAAGALDRLAALMRVWGGPDAALHLRQASGHLKKLVELAQAMNHMERAAALKHQRANVLRQLGGSDDVAVSRSLYEQALNELPPNSAAWACAADDFAGLLEEFGENEEALRIRVSAVETIRRVGDGRDLSTALSNLGAAYTEFGDRIHDAQGKLVMYRLAEESYTESVDTEYARVPSAWRALQLRRRALIRHRIAVECSGSFESCLQDFADAYAMATEFEPTDKMAEYAELWGEAAMAASDYRTAERLLSEALDGHAQRFTLALSPTTRLEIARAGAACARTAAGAALLAGTSVAALEHLERWPGLLTADFGDEHRSLAVEALRDTMAGDFATGSIARDVTRRGLQGASGQARPSSVADDLAVVTATHDVVVAFQTRRESFVVVVGAQGPSQLKFERTVSDPEAVTKAVQRMLETSGRPVVVVEQLHYTSLLHTRTPNGTALVERAPVSFHLSVRTAAAARSIVRLMNRYQPVGTPPADLVFASAELRASADVLATNGDVAVEPPIGASQLVAGQTASGAVAHLACHGFAHPTQPLSTQLIFASETVTVADLLSASLSGNVSLVVVAACESAVRDHDTISEPFSVAAAIQSAGVSAIGTFERIDDLAASLLVVRFFELLAADRRDADCGPRLLAEAQAWLRYATRKRLGEWTAQHPTLRAAMDSSHPTFFDTHHNPQGVPFSDPTYWAAFAYFGW